MSQLKIKTWKIIDESEFSELVSTIYGRPYRLQQQGEMIGNDATYPIDVPNDFAAMDEDHRESREWERASGAATKYEHIDPVEYPTFQEWLDRDVNEPVPDASTDFWVKHSNEDPQIPKPYIPPAEDRLPGGLIHDLWWTRNFFPPLGEVINDLHKRGLLQEGEYRIHAWW